MGVAVGTSNQCLSYQLAPCIYKYVHATTSAVPISIFNEGEFQGMCKSFVPDDSVFGKAR